MSKRFLKQTWRWYGPQDSVSLSDVKQAGATGIVSALHHIPHGEVWTKEEITKRKNIIEEEGLEWSVVESLPVHEDIKTRSGNHEQLIQNYTKSLENLTACGIQTVCYNFMPVLDWTRTQLDKELENGAKALNFNWIDLAVFDLYILKREEAFEEYAEDIKTQAKDRFENADSNYLNALCEIVLMGIPSEGNISIESLRKSIETYKSIGKEGLKKNHIWFLQQISDTCMAHGIKMTIHPDDPPYPILGLPRIASNLEDLIYIITKVDEEFNGICFCTGSLGASQTNELVKILEQVKHKVYFAHLRNVKKDEIGNFYESDHLDGDVDMYNIVRLLVEENQGRENSIPFRPDHGHEMLDDIGKETNPGYSAIGRLKGLAELRGLELGIISSNNT